MKKTIKKISGKISTAFLLRNFRNLGFEEKTVLIANITTFLFCFFPWMSITPLYGDGEFFSAFSGPTSIMGIAIFLLSIVNISFFSDKILQTKVWKTSIPQNIVIGFLSFQQIILIVSVWSVLIAFGENLSEMELRFGISMVLFSQIISFTANALLLQKQKKKSVQEFFNTTPESNE